MTKCELSGDAVKAINATVSDAVRSAIADWKRCLENAIAADERGCQRVRTLDESHQEVNQAAAPAPVPTEGEALHMIAVACRGLIDHVRWKYSIDDDKPFECEHMRAIEEAMKATQIVSTTIRTREYRLQEIIKAMAQGDDILRSAIEYCVDFDDEFINPTLRKRLNAALDEYRNIAPAA